MSSSSSILGICVAALAALCWGVVYAAVQNLVAGNRAVFTATTLLVTSFLAGSVFLFPVLVSFNRGEVFHMLLAGNADVTWDFLAFVCSVVASEFVLFYSVKLLGGTDASLVQVSYPVWTALILFITQGEKPSEWSLFGGTLILAGVVLIALYPNSQPSSSHTSPAAVATTYASIA